MGKLLLFVGHQPREVGLVLSIDTGHQLYVGTETLAVDTPLFHLLRCRLVGQIAVPGASEVTVAPRPLLLARREMVRGHMQHASLGVVLITALEVETGIHAHITRRHVDVLVVRDVHT